MIQPQLHTAFSYLRHRIQFTYSNHRSMSYCICHLSLVITVSIRALISPVGKSRSYGDHFQEQ